MLALCPDTLSGKHDRALLALGSSVHSSADDCDEAAYRERAEAPLHEIAAQAEKQAYDSMFIS